MKFNVIVRGDMNDADYIEKSTVLDFDIDPFEGWSKEEGPKHNWHDILTAFSDSIKEYQAIKDKENRWYYNWTEDAQEAIYLKVAEKLKHVRGYTADYYQELLWDLIPGTHDYPMHSIENITAIPYANTVTYF